MPSVTLTLIRKKGCIPGYTFEDCFEPEHLVFETPVAFAHQQFNLALRRLITTHSARGEKHFFYTTARIPTRKDYRQYCLLQPTWVEIACQSCGVKHVIKLSYAALALIREGYYVPVLEVNEGTSSGVVLCQAFICATKEQVYHHRFNTYCQECIVRAAHCSASSSST